MKTYELLHHKVEKTLEHQHWRTQAFDWPYLSLMIKCNSFEPALFLYILQPLYIIRDMSIVSNIRGGIQRRRNRDDCGLYWHPGKPFIPISVAESLVRFQSQIQGV
jgi:hypothetical protein